MNRVTLLLAAGLVFLAAASLPIMRAGALQAVVTDDNLDQMIASAKNAPRPPGYRGVLRARGGGREEKGRHPSAHGGDISEFEDP